MRSDLDRYLAASARIQLQVDEAYVPDALMLPSEYEGPHLVAVVHANRIAALTTAGRVTRALEPGTDKEILDAACRARAEDARPGADTAVGRTMTWLTLRADQAPGGAESFAAVASVNHLVPQALPSGWSTALRLLRNAIGPLRGAAADAWDLAMAWCLPADLGDGWQAGRSIRLPDIVTTIEHEGTLWLRAGERAYVLSDTVLRSRDDVIAPQGGARRWELPCGAGVVALDDWGAGRRVLVRRDDDRSIEVSNRDPDARTAGGNSA